MSIQEYIDSTSNRGVAKGLPGPAARRPKLEPAGPLNALQ